jgi:DNA-binding transcriptional regulator PaaX
VARYTERTEIINSLLRFFITSGLITTALIAPNILQVLDKPLRRYYKKLDKAAREKEYKYLLGYMKKHGLIKYRAQQFNGIRLTKEGVERAEKADLDKIEIKKPLKWDKKWRIIFFDIPELNKTARDCLSRKLKELGFLQLQKSVWIHPFYCRDEVAAIGEQYNVRKYVTYIETSYIDSEKELIQKFKSLFYPL